MTEDNHSNAHQGAQQACWQVDEQPVGSVCEADWAGMEQNPDNAGGLTLDTLRAQASIDWARTVPYPKLLAAHAAAKGR
jgi:hypothetical protein